MKKYSARYWYEKNKYAVGYFYAESIHQGSEVYFVYGNKSAIVKVSQLEAIGLVREKE